MTVCKKGFPAPITQYPATDWNNGEPIPGDKARVMLNDVAAALRKEAGKNENTRAFKGAYPVPIGDYPFHRAYHGANEKALNLAADVLQRAADGEIKGLGDLIRFRAASMRRTYAVQAVSHEVMEAWRAGEPIGREEAYRRANEALGRNDCKKLYLEWEAEQGVKVPFPKVKRNARTKQA